MEPSGPHITTDNHLQPLWWAYLLIKHFLAWLKICALSTHRWASPAVLLASSPVSWWMISGNMLLSWYDCWENATWMNLTSFLNDNNRSIPTACSVKRYSRWKLVLQEPQVRVCNCHSYLFDCSIKILTANLNHISLEVQSDARRPQWIQ